MEDTEDVEVFEDALEEAETAGEGPIKDIPLELGLAEGQEAIDLFFDNRFEDARKIVTKHCDKSIYHALGIGTFQFIEAVMTFEQERIEKASTVLSQSLATIDRFRRKSGGLVDALGKMVGRKDYNGYTEMEMHAELVYAEVLLLKALLTVCEDETLVSFVKAGLKVRQCYLSFRTCWEILDGRNWSEKEDKFKSHFEGGVQLGVGTFNLTMSLLPPRITKLLQFIGLTGSRSHGMTQLLQCYHTDNCIRHFLSCLILLGYNLFVTFHTGQPENCDFRLVKEILDSKLAKHPAGGFFMFFQGRHKFVSGDCSGAVLWYDRATQNLWKHLQHIGRWEMMWAASYQCDWSGALLQSDKLLAESKWSPCLYSYLKAAHYCMLPELSPAQAEEQRHLMATLPGLKQKIGGKSLPMEKFAIRKAERWTKQGGRLVLPGIELVYLWNGFSILGQQFHLVETYYAMVEQELAAIKARPEERMFQLEDECLLLVLKGVCLKYMSAPLAAEETFRLVLQKTSAEPLKADRYLLPYASVELALLLLQDNSQAAWELLETAKNYKDYSLQSRLHFRIHAAQNRILAGRTGSEGSDIQEEGCEPLVHLKEDRGKMLQELENCSDSKIREMVPHI